MCTGAFYSPETPFALRSNGSCLAQRKVSRHKLGKVSGKEAHHIAAFLSFSHVCLFIYFLEKKNEFWLVSIAI